jgi:hypothetical protein
LWRFVELWNSSNRDLLLKDRVDCLVQSSRRKLLFGSMG